MNEVDELADNPRSKELNDFPLLKFKIPEGSSYPLLEHKSIGNVLNVQKMNNNPKIPSQKQHEPKPVPVYKSPEFVRRGTNIYLEPYEELTRTETSLHSKNVPKFTRLHVAHERLRKVLQEEDSEENDFILQHGITFAQHLT